MRSRLRLEKFSEGWVVHFAVDGGLETHGLEAEVEELPRAPLRARAPLAPRLLAGFAVELQVKAQIIGDREGRPLIEVGDEVGGDCSLAGVPPHR